jgi:hypothetical protein
MGWPTQRFVDEEACPKFREQRSVSATPTGRGLEAHADELDDTDGQDDGRHQESGAQREEDKLHD